MNDVVTSVSGNFDLKTAVDLDHALSVAGIGVYNVKYCFVLSLFLIAPIIETVGYSFILPAASCDLNISDLTRGLVSSIPYIGVILTSYPWGYLVDTKGRKRVIIYSSLVAGTFGVLSAFMPDIITFAVCKSITALCIACASTIPYSYIGEILPQKYRDVMLSIINALQITGSTLVPLLAWGILPLDFRINFGLYEFRSWRILVIVYSLFFIIPALLISFGPESPKYLMSQGKHEEALTAIKMIYYGNKRKSQKDFPIKQLKHTTTNQNEKLGFIQSLKVQTLPLWRPPYLKWLCLNGFLFFGIYATLNGLYIWVPDVLNRVMTGDGTGMTACEVIGERLDETSTTGECVDTIDPITFFINTVANLTCAVIAVAVSSTVKIIGKKRLLVIIYIMIGTFLILINFITQDVLFAVLLSSLPIMGLGMGPINAFAVEIFPTHLRGMAVSLSMMLGRFGSIIGTNVAGILLNAACEATFYSFGGLLILCGFCSLLLPKSNTAGRTPAKKPNYVTKL